MAKQAARMRISAPPEHNALRSRGCPNPDRALVRTRKRAPVRVQVAQTPVAPLSFRVETLRRNWQAAVTLTRRLKAEGQPWREAANRARDYRAQLVALDPDLAVTSREIELSQSSASNKVKAVD